jgi:lipopolysaccharide export system permease protein
MVLLVLLALGGFIEFMSQLDELGEGNYSLGRALFYVLLKLPRMAADMLPVSVLLGALLGLGALASHSELIVMRAAGVSLAQLGRLVAVTGVVIAIFGAVLGEYIGPPLDRYARQYKAVSKNNDVRLTGGAAIWLRDGNSIYNINRSEDGFGYGGV